MALKFYYHLVSQPCRALYTLLKLSKIDAEFIAVDLPKGEHRTKDFKQLVSKFQRVPVIHHNEFKLTESVAILRYLSREFNLADKYYPRDSKRQAKCDEYLEWQHNELRINCAMYFRAKWWKPIVTGEEPSEKILLHWEKPMAKTLDFMENVWLAKGPFIVGDSLTAADIWALCEIEQPRKVLYDVTVGRPKLSKWMEKVEFECSPFYLEANSFLDEIEAEFFEKLRQIN